MFAGAAFVAHVHRRGRIVADKDYGKPWHAGAACAAQIDLRAQRIEEFVGNALAVEKLCSHAGIFRTSRVAAEAATGRELSQLGYPWLKWGRFACIRLSRRVVLGRSY